MPKTPHPEAETMAADAATLEALGRAPKPPASEAIPSGAGTAELVAGRYRIVALVGAGGMGSVYRALDTELDEVVALKVLKAELVASPDALERFRREVKLARKVTHRNVARAFDIGEHRGEKFLTMEFVEGRPLSRDLERHGALPTARALQILGEICEGLAVAHAAGVIHRDLKPDNVLLADDGRVVVTDFGIARAVADSGTQRTVGMVLGTPTYMAPEQVEGRAIDARTDLYALGCMAFEMLSGRAAWTGDSAFTVAAARLVSPPPDLRAARPDLPDSVVALVARCLERDPAARIGSAIKLRDALATAAAGLGAATGARVMPQQTARSSGASATTPAPVLPLSTSSSSGTKAVAVLPLKNQGPPEDDAVADGLTDDLVDTLSMTRGLRVRPRAAVAALKPGERDPRELGRELGVQVVVEGSLRRVGERVRVSARLTSVEEGFQLWARRFDTTPADLLVVADEAAHAIAEALTSDLQAPVRAAPNDGTAVELYLRARSDLRKFWHSDLANAIALLERALQLAPDDPTLLAAYARARLRVAFFGGEGTEESRRLARDAARRAMECAPERGESWLAKGSVCWNEGDIAGAATALKEALKRAPNLAEAHDLLGRITLEVGRPRDALQRLETAINLDPTSLATRLELARAHALLDDWKAVEHWLFDAAPADEVTTTPLLLIAARLVLWSPEPARLAARVPAFDATQNGPLAYARGAIDAATTGRTSQEQRELIRMAVQTAPAGSRFRAMMGQLAAEMSASLGETDQAMDSLRLSVESGLIDLCWIDRCPVLDPLRVQPQFPPLRAIVQERAEQVLQALMRP